MKIGQQIGTKFHMMHYNTASTNPVQTHSINSLDYIIVQNKSNIS